MAFNRLLVTKDVAYASNGAAGTISGMNEIDLLEEGAVAIFNDKNVLVPAIPADTLDDSKYFIIAVGQASG